jgi:hypothetical protein
VIKRILKSKDEKELILKKDVKTKTESGFRKRMKYVFIFITKKTLFLKQIRPKTVL